MLFTYRTQIDDEFDDFHLPHQPPGDFTNSTDQLPQNILPDNVTDSSNFDHSVLSFTHNPLCPTLTSHPDLTLSNSVTFPQDPVKICSGKDNKMKTFPA